jgi:hypothetical protein
VDASHANGRPAWERRGAPLEPDPRQWRAIRAASALHAGRLGGGRRLRLAPNAFALIEADHG